MTTHQAFSRAKIRWALEQALGKETVRHLITGRVTTPAMVDAACLTLFDDRATETQAAKALRAYRKEMREHGFVSLTGDRSELEDYTGGFVRGEV